MSEQALQQWVRMIAVGHAEGIHYDDANALIVLNQIPNPQAMVKGLANNGNIPAAERAALEALTEIDGFAGLTGAAAPQDPGVVMSSLQIILVLAAVGLGAPVLVIAGRMLMPAAPAIEAEQRQQISPAADFERNASRGDGAGSCLYGRPRRLAARRNPNAAAARIHNLARPSCMRSRPMSRGRNYDDSFAIEQSGEAGGQFLGECGFVWRDASRRRAAVGSSFGASICLRRETLTKVFAAPAALSDPAFQASVANRLRDVNSDIVAAEPGATLMLDGGSIQNPGAVVRSVIFNYGGGLPNSGIESLQIELFAWRKQGAQPGLPATGYPAPAATPFSEYADLPLGTPAETTSPAPPPPASGSYAPRPSDTPLKPKRPEDDQDDPFGGTGNFMPYS